MVKYADNLCAPSRGFFREYRLRDRDVHFYCFKEEAASIRCYLLDRRNIAMG